LAAEIAKEGFAGAKGANIEKDPDEKTLDSCYTHRTTKGKDGKDYIESILLEKRHPVSAFIRKPRCHLVLVELGSKATESLAVHIRIHTRINSLGG
jgi:hypothetical protein